MRALGVLAVLIAMGLVPLVSSAQTPPNNHAEVGRFLEADEIMVEANGGVTARGNVVVQHSNEVLTADSVIYNKSANAVIAKGNIRPRNSAGVVTSVVEMPEDMQRAFLEALR